jgi:hypothetical protein
MRRLVILLGAMWLTAGCASMRGVDVGADAGTTYAIEVVNNRSGTITVAYTAGGESNHLGTVAARQTERFIIASPKSTNIMVVATTSAGSSVGSYNVNLVAGSTQRVTVR